MVSKKTGISLATVASVVAILSGLYVMDAFSIFVFADDYEQDQMEQMTRSDGFELRHVKEEITYLKKERRDVRDILFNMPDDEEAHEEMDEIEAQLDDFEARKCFLMKRNGMEC